MTPEITALFQKFLAGRCSRAEAEQLLAYFLSQEGEEEMARLIQQELDKPVVGEESNPVDGFNPERQLEALRRRIRNKAPSPRMAVRYQWLPYAAAVLVAASIVIGLLLPWDSPTRPSAELSFGQGPADVAPGGNRAILTLDDGSAISLSESQDGIVIGDGIHYEDGTRVYEANLGPSDAGFKPQYATLSTPNGGTYSVTLSDGTRVWLNAASTLRYPTTFSNGARIVELEGEAYFAVTPRTAQQQSFRVISRGQEVEVLGTEFNISAYRNEAAVKTTLVKGVVRVQTANANRHETNYTTLRPGEQSRVINSQLDKMPVDIASAIAWKSGKFHFDGKSFEQIMNEVARWYDLEVVYQGNVPTDQLVGDAYRTQNLSIVLKMLDVLDVNYDLNIHDRKLTIYSGKGASSGVRR